jgi:hypothetical protein
MAPRILPLHSVTSCSGPASVIRGGEGVIEDLQMVEITNAAFVRPPSGLC